MEQQTIIVIGGGLGGLFTGAFLCKEGYKVIVLEKNHTVGGGLQCFKRGNDFFETGMHVLGGFQEGGSLYKICRYLGIMDKLRIKPTDADAIDSITYRSDGRTYFIPRTKERFIQYFSSEFPEEREHIDRYVNAMYALSEEVDLFYLRRGSSFLQPHSDDFTMPADEFIARYIENPRLRELFAYMNPMYGGVPGHTPAYIHALINVLYIEGSSQFEDGSQQLADALCGLITSAGGEIHTNEEVVHIDVEDHMVKSLVTKGGDVFAGDIYISDIHPCTLLGLIDKEAFPAAYRKRMNIIPNSYSCFTVYIKFKHDAFPYINHPHYYQTDDGMVWRLGEPVDEFWPRGLMCITPPSKEQGKWASRMIVTCIMPFAEVRQWENTYIGHRGPEYEKWKEKHKQKILHRLEELHPGISGDIDYCFSSSPLTIRDYYGTKDGSMYGFQADSKNLLMSVLPIYTKVRNLFLTGQNVNLHGICGVPLTAIEVAEALVGKNVIIDKINQFRAQADE